MFKWSGNWDFDVDESRARELLLKWETWGTVAPEKRPKFLFCSVKDFARACILMRYDAERLTVMKAFGKLLAEGRLPETFSIHDPMTYGIQELGTAQHDKVAAELGLTAYHQIADLTVQLCSRDVRVREASEVGKMPDHYPQLEGVAIPLTVLGVAAIAALTYWAVEDEKQTAIVEVEKAWAMARAHAEIELAKQVVLAGGTPKMSDWGMRQTKLAQIAENKWTPYVAAGVGVALLGGAYMLTRGSKAAGTTVVVPNPSRRAPVSRKPPRKRNPRRAEFIRAAKKHGASQSKAEQLWRDYLHGTRRRAAKSKRGRRRNPPAARPAGKRTSGARSTVKRSASSGRAGTAKSRTSARAGRPASRATAKRAAPAAKSNPKRAPKRARASGKKRAKRSKRRG